MGCVLNFSYNEVPHSVAQSPFKEQDILCYYDIIKPYHQSLVGVSVNKE